MISQEIETYYLIPAIRREIVKKMVEKGLSQREVAEKMKLTKSAVSQYISGKRGKKFSLDDGLVDNSAERIINGEHYLKVIQDLLSELKKDKKICLIYAKNNIRPEDCEVCNHESVSR